MSAREGDLVRITESAHKMLDSQSKLIGLVVSVSFSDKRHASPSIVRVLWPDKQVPQPINTLWLERVV